MVLYLIILLTCYSQREDKNEPSPVPRLAINKRYLPTFFLNLYFCFNGSSYLYTVFEIMRFIFYRRRGSVVTYLLCKSAIASSIVDRGRLYVYLGSGCICTCVCKFCMASLTQGRLWTRYFTRPLLKKKLLPPSRILHKKIKQNYVFLFSCEYFNFLNGAFEIPKSFLLRIKIVWINNLFHFLNLCLNNLKCILNAIL